MSKHKCKCECERATAKKLSKAISRATALLNLPVDNRRGLSLDLDDWDQMELLLQRFSDAEYAAHNGKRLDCGSGSCWIASMRSALKAFVR